MSMQHSVRIADLGQGTNPIRVTSIRSLPDADVDEALHDVDDAIKESLTREHVVGPILQHFCPLIQTPILQNIEVSFAYRALPSGATANSKAHNAQYVNLRFHGYRIDDFEYSLLVEFYLGVSGAYEFNFRRFTRFSACTAHY